MKIDSDGSLPRITSSAKDLRNNVRIIKVPNSVPSYKLVIIKPTIEHKESSEKSSDAELSDDDLFDIKIPSKNVEKEKVVDNKTDNLDKQNEADSEGIMRERNHYNRHRQYHNKNNRYYGRRNSTYNKISKHYKSISNMRGIYNYGNRDLNSTNQDYKLAGSRIFSSVPSGRDINSTPGGRDINSAPGSRDINSGASGRDINSVASGGRDFNSAGNQDYNIADFTSTPNQDFNSTADHHVTYNNDNYQHPVQHPSDFSIPPWRDFPRLPQYPHAPFSHVPHPGMSRHSLGLLGDRPSYASSLPMFQPNNPNNNFVCDQTAPYPSISNFPPNNHNNSFVHNQNSSYSQKTSNYPSSKKTDSFISDKNYRNDSYGNYRSNNQLRNKHMNDDNKRKQNTWDKGPRRHPNERNNSSRNNKSYRK